MNLKVFSLIWACPLWIIVEGFTVSTSFHHRQVSPNIHVILSSRTAVDGLSCLYATSDEQVDSKPEQGEEERSKLDAFLEKKYKSFYKLINDEMMKAIKQGSVTVFVPNDVAFQALGEKKLKQLEDPRNEEIREKMGSYHIMPEPISAIELRTEDWTKGRPKNGSKPSK
jgi:uncharacterized surface protein with fasciclin (FAS1) repeats